MSPGDKQCKCRKLVDFSFWGGSKRHTYHVEVLLIVASQQEQQGGTGLVQDWVPAQVRKKSPELPHSQ